MSASNSPASISAQKLSLAHAGEAVFEIALCVLLCFVLAGSAPPDVNEAHYLAKARHYWNPDWCSSDFFLNTADAHRVYYWTFGWLTLLLTLPAVAWTGRLLTWVLLAWAWRRLSRAVVPGNLYAVLGFALFATLNRWGHLSGEWVVGGVEAKGFAYVLVLLGVEAVVVGRWRRALFLQGMAAAMHVLVGGWALVATGSVWLMTRRELRPSFLSLVPGLLLALAAALPGLIPALQLTALADGDTVREANRIYVFERLSHHLAFHDMPHVFMLRHGVLILAWAVLARARSHCNESALRIGRLNRFVGGAVAIAVLGVVLDQSLLNFPTAGAALLRFYFFRMSDVIVPAGLSLLLVALLDRMSAARSTQSVPLLGILLLIVTLDACHATYRHLVDPRPGAVIQALPAPECSREEKQRRLEDWKDVCRWIQVETEVDAVFLTPRHQQTFKWYAQRSEVVTGKDIPQDAAGIVEWRRRMTAIYPPWLRQAGVGAHGEKRLQELAVEFNFRYIVVDRSQANPSLAFRRVYPSRGGDRSFEVYEVARP